MTSGVPLQGGAGIPPIPAVDFSKFGEIQEQKLSKIQRPDRAEFKPGLVKLTASDIS